MGELERLEPGPRWLEAFARTGGEVAAAGSFRALFHSRALGVNYAYPVRAEASSEAVERDLAALRALFAARSLPLQIEFNEPLFADLPPALAAAGLTPTEREPLLVLSASELRPMFNPGVAVRFLDADDEEGMLAYATIFHQVLLELPGSPSERTLARLRQEVAEREGQSHALATIDGRPAGSGFVSSDDGVAEITRVATVPAARRRGVAATITSFMIADRFGQGDTLAWLTASGEAAQALYLKLGFRLVGDRLYYEDSSDPSPA